MFTSSASKLDIEKFQKVRALMNEGATEGERKAARAAATRIARAAGMTLLDACVAMDNAPKPQPTVNIFEGFGDWMEQREPGYKARMAAEKEQRERERRARCRELLKEYGSEEAVFAETDIERRLRERLEPLADRKNYWESAETYINGYAGWTRREPTPPLLAALREAHPFPDTIEAVWQELQHWRALAEARIAFFPDYDMPVWVRAREAGLHSMMDTKPAPTIEGIRTRLAWLEHVNNLGYSRDVHEDAKLIAALTADFESVAASGIGRTPAQSGHAQPGRRTNADKRAEVLSILDASPDLTDREIARRAGVSPQTVNTWRKKRRVQI